MVLSRQGNAQGSSLMPIIKLESAVIGDVLKEDVILGGIPLFDAGTVLNKRRIDVLSVFGVETITIESRIDSDYITVSEAVERIEERFSYVKDIPLMMTIKSWIQDIVRHQGEKSD